MSVSQWMSWEGGVDLVAATEEGLVMPNVLVHVARIVHAPVGSAPSGMLLYQPDPAAPPAVMGFISSAPEVGKYFGPSIFAGTPFEQAPVLQATIEVELDLPDSVGAKVTVGDFVFETRLSDLGAMELVNRPSAAMTPFVQQGIERAAARTSLTVNGKEVKILVPPVGITGGPAAVYSPCGTYAR